MLVPARPSCPRRCARWTGAIFTLAALKSLGAQVTPQESGLPRRGRRRAGMDSL